MVIRFAPLSGSGLSSSFLAPVGEARAEAWGTASLARATQLDGMLGAAGFTRWTGLSGLAALGIPGLSSVASLGVRGWGGFGAGSGLWRADTWMHWTVSAGPLLGAAAMLPGVFGGGMAAMGLFGGAAAPPVGADVALSYPGAPNARTTPFAASATDDAETATTHGPARSVAGVAPAPVPVPEPERTPDAAGPRRHEPVADDTTELERLRRPAERDAKSPPPIVSEPEPDPAPTAADDAAPDDVAPAPVPRPDPEPVVPPPEPVPPSPEPELPPDRDPVPEPPPLARDPDPAPPRPEPPPRVVPPRQPELPPRAAPPPARVEPPAPPPRAEEAPAVAPPPVAPDAMAGDIPRADAALAARLAAGAVSIGGFPASWKLDGSLATYVDAAIQQFKAEAASAGLREGTPAWEEAMVDRLFAFVRRDRPAKDWPVAAVKAGAGLGLNITGIQDDRRSQEWGEIARVIDQRGPDKNKRGECSEQTAVLLALAARAGVQHLRAVEVTETRESEHGLTVAHPVSHVCAGLERAGQPQPLLYDLGMKKKAPAHTETRPLAHATFIANQAGNQILDHLQAGRVGAAQQVLDAALALAPESAFLWGIAADVAGRRTDLPVRDRVLLAAQALQRVLRIDGLPRPGTISVTRDPVAKAGPLDIVTAPDRNQPRRVTNWRDLLQLTRWLAVDAKARRDWGSVYRYQGEYFQMLLTQRASVGVVAEAYDALLRAARGGRPTPAGAEALLPGPADHARTYLQWIDTALKAIDAEQQRPGFTAGHHKMLDFRRRRLLKEQARVRGQIAVEPRVS